LVKRPKFSLDTAGVIPQDSCISLALDPDRRGRGNQLSQQLTASLGREAKPADVLKYCLAFVNSDFAFKRLVMGRRPTPKGYYAITEAYLSELPIPPPDSRRATEILDIVGKLIASQKSDTQELQSLLDKVIRSFLK
jgi:hypothetical protein